MKGKLRWIGFVGVLGAVALLVITQEVLGSVDTVVTVIAIALAALGAFGVRFTAGKVFGDGRKMAANITGAIAFLGAAIGLYFWWKGAIDTNLALIEGVLFYGPLAIVVLGSLLQLVCPKDD